jgi:hypothetical protein
MSGRDIDDVRPHHAVAELDASGSVKASRRMSSGQIYGVVAWKVDGAYERGLSVLHGVTALPLRAIAPFNPSHSIT